MNNTPAPSPFSAANPHLQIAWDATSLKALMTCPRYYQYAQLEGWRTAVAGDDIMFGGCFASAAEAYKRSRLAGRDKAQATRDALRVALEKSGEYVRTIPEDINPQEFGVTFAPQKWVPWSGAYIDQWRCTGTEKYKNKKGNAAKCPYAHKGAWFDEPGPSVCGECGSPTEHVNHWASDNPAKDRYALIRLVAWYCEDQPETADDPGLFPFAFLNGTPAVELPFRIPLDLRTPTGEPYILCGYFDSIVSFGGNLFIADNKTTKKTLGAGYFRQYAPNVQVDLYDLAGSLLFPTLPLRGVLIEGAQTLVGGAAFGLHPEFRSETLRAEFYEEVKWWIAQAERYAESGYWPMNRASCYLCPFKGICSVEPQSRETFLKAGFIKRHWNPLQER